MPLTPVSRTPGPPPAAEAQLSALRAALDRDVPPKAIDRNVLVATWRWTLMADVDPTWEPSSNATWRTVECCAEVVSRFDIVGLQGVMKESALLHAVLHRLGGHWSYMMTLLEGPTSYKERTALVFDTRRASHRGLAGQLVLPDRVKGGNPSFATSQFYRPPQYAVFRVVGGDLAVLNIHLIYGDEEERLAEMEGFVGAVRRVAADGSVAVSHTIALGQIQLRSMGSRLAQALLAAGLTVPPALHDRPTFVSRAGRPASMASAIAWFNGDGPGLDERLMSAGVFNHVEHFQPDTDMTSHLPTWVELVARPARW